MERRQILNEFTVVGTMTAAFVISILNWINSLFDPTKLLGWRAWIVVMLAATGTYLFVFKLAIWIYYHAIWKLVHAERYIAGEWKYKYNDSYDAAKDTWDSGADRSGVAHFGHTIEDISMHGESSEDSPAKPGGTTLRTTWQARASALHEFRINALISLTSGTFSDDAFMILQIVPRSKLWKVIPRFPTQLRGHYYIPPKSTVPTRYARIEFDR